MKVLMLQDVAKVGKKGQIVDVSDGFALNALLPQKKAVPATGDIVAKVEDAAKGAAQKAAKEKAWAEELKARIEKKTISLQVKAGPDGKLFGAVREKDIADKLSKDVGREIDKSHIKISTVRTLGEHLAKVTLGGGVMANLKINITPL